MKRILLWSVTLLFLGACAAKPPSDNRKIVAEVKIKRVGSFLSDGGQTTDINETFWLDLKQDNIVGFADPSERIVAAEGKGSGEREAFIINPEPAGDAIRFFIYRDKEFLGTIRLMEKPGAKGYLSSGFYSVNLAIKSIENPE